MMKFTVDPSVGYGTYLIGYVTATREKLTSVFGQPLTYEEGDKVTTEWGIIFEDGTIATIYDWKRYELGAPSLTEVYEWHIGGTSKRAEELVKEELLKRELITIALGTY